MQMKSREMAQAGGEKHGEGGPAHLARGHRKRAMMDRSQPGCMTVDRHIVGWVGKHHRGLLRAHQEPQGHNLKHVGAQHPVLVEHP
jgi:hypothetical protein